MTFLYTELTRNCSQDFEQNCTQSTRARNRDYIDKIKENQVTKINRAE